MLKIRWFVWFACCSRIIRNRKTHCVVSEYEGRSLSLIFNGRVGVVSHSPSASTAFLAAFFRTQSRIRPSSLLERTPSGPHQSSKNMHRAERISNSFIVFSTEKSIVRATRCGIVGKSMKKTLTIVRRIPLPASSRTQTSFGE